MKNLIWFKSFLISGIAAFIVPNPVVSQSLTVERIATGLDAPVFATFAPGDFERLYVVQRGGTIRVLNLTTDALSDFIEVPSVSSGGERGLLGLAFHPDFQSNGLFFVNYTDDSGNDTRIVRFTAANNDVANPETESLVMEIEQPQSNHNGGWIGFGPDGFLYIAMGDGGSSNDNGSGHTDGSGNAQDITDNLLGKMLRIDVNSDDFPADEDRNYAIPISNPFVDESGDDEIFAYGIRNPWRCSFDRGTGDLYIADVGQGEREEVTVLNDSNGGQNLGWRLREGTIQNPHNVGDPVPAGAIAPIYDYDHGNGPFEGNSITGGYVYRGPIAALQGHYFFADYVSDNIWSLKHDASEPISNNGMNFTELTRWNEFLTTNEGTVTNISSFGEDAAGNLYVVDIGGEIFKIVEGSFGTPSGSFGGDVEVEVNNGDLRVIGENNTDQCIIVSATSTPGQFQFSSISGDEGKTSGTTFNGQATLVVGGVTDDMRFDIKSGLKVLILTEEDESEFACPDDLRITSTGSEPIIIILDSANVGGRTDIKTRDGDDTILICNSTFTERMRSNTGNGDDIFVDGVDVPASFFGDDLDFRAGNDNDLCVCNGTIVADRASPRMGNDDDGIAITNCILGQTTAYGNGGFDLFATEASTFASLSLRQIENELKGVQLILDDLQASETYQDAMAFVFGLGLNE